MLKITLLTWNCGNAVPSEDTISKLQYKLFPSDKKEDWPDLIVIGLQEACREGAKFGVIGGHSLTESLCKNSPYVKILSHSMIGLTKPGQENPNTQHLGIMCRSKDINVKVGSEKTSLSGKGGIFGICTYKSLNITAITAHLDSNSDIKRNSQVNNIMNKAKPTNLTHCTFFMGDLNYRIQIDKLTRIGISPYTDSFVKALFSPNELKKLWKTSHLNESSLVKTHGFIFPIPQKIFLPTYKYPEPDKGAALIRSREVLAEACENMDSNTDIHFIHQAIRNCLLDNKKDKGRGELEMGWLDQIGYIIKNSHIDILEYTSMPNIMQSDHLPVIMKANITESDIISTHTNSNNLFHFSINYTNPQEFSLHVAKKLSIKNMEKSKVREYLGECIKIELKLPSTSEDILQITQIKNDKTQLNYYVTEILNQLRKGVSNTIALCIYQISNDQYNKLREKKDQKYHELADKIMILTVSLLQAFEYLKINYNMAITSETPRAQKVILDALQKPTKFKERFEKWYKKNKNEFKEFFKDY
jgi:hypothetical protein